jgi:hypothetical protein
MDVEALRTAFAAHLGTEQFRKFVFELDGCRGRGRLKFWMQEAWEGFVRGHPEWAMAFDDLQRVFLVCRVHRCELTPATVRLVGASVRIRDSDAYHTAWNGQFPHSYAELPADFPHPTRMVETYLCPACRAARGEWSRTNTSSELVPLDGPQS